MTFEEYSQLLKKKPDEQNPRFMVWLQKNNEVVYMDHSWMLIKNIKYWTKKNDWLTAFSFRVNNKYIDMTNSEQNALNKLIAENKIKDYAMHINDPVNQSIKKRLHIHFFKNSLDLIEAYGDRTTDNTSSKASDD